jgi:hypothetical protein
MCVENAIEFWMVALELKLGEPIRTFAEYIGSVIKLIQKSKLLEIAINQPSVFNQIFINCISKYSLQLKSSSESSQVEIKPKLLSFFAVSECLHDYETMFLNQKFTDVDLEINGKILKAHKNILSSTYLLFKICKINFPRKI